MKLASCELFARVYTILLCVSNYFINSESLNRKNPMASLTTVFSQGVGFIPRRLPEISLFRFSAKGYLSELRRATCPEESHSSYSSPFSYIELFSVGSNLSSSTAIGPDKVANSMLKHLPRPGMNFLLHIFNLSRTSRSFPSIWKTSSIIPIYKMGKPLDSLASFRPFCLTSCVSKRFERIILSRLFFFLESNSILSLCKAGFRP